MNQPAVSIIPGNPLPPSLPPSTQARVYSWTDVALRFLAQLPDLGVIAVVAILAREGKIETSISLVTLLAVLAGRLNPSALKLSGAGGGALHGAAILPLMVFFGAVLRRIGLASVLTLAITLGFGGVVVSSCTPAQVQGVKTGIEVGTVLCKAISVVSGDGTVTSLCADEAEIAQLISEALADRRLASSAPPSSAPCQTLSTSLDGGGAAACLTDAEILAGIRRTLARRKALTLRDAAPEAHPQ